MESVPAAGSRRGESSKRLTGRWVRDGGPRREPDGRASGLPQRVLRRRRYSRCESYPEAEYASSAGEEARKNQLSLGPSLCPVRARVEILRRSSTTAYIGIFSSEVGHSKRSRSCSCARAGQGTRLTASTRRGRVPSCGRTFVRFHSGLRTLVRGPERRSGAQPRSWESGKCRRTSLRHRVGSLFNTNVYIRRLFSSRTGSLTLLKHGENSQGQLGKNE
jgi:hypothetical protein